MDHELPRRTSGFSSVVFLCAILASVHTKAGMYGSTILQLSGFKWNGISSPNGAYPDLTKLTSVDASLQALDAKLGSTAYETTLTFMQPFICTVHRRIVSTVGFPTTSEASTVGDVTDSSVGESQGHDGSCWPSASVDPVTGGGRCDRSSLECIEARYE